VLVLTTVPLLFEIYDTFWQSKYLSGRLNLLNLRRESIEGPIDQQANKSDFASVLEVVEVYNSSLEVPKGVFFKHLRKAAGTTVHKHIMGLLGDMNSLTRGHVIYESPMNQSFDDKPIYKYYHQEFDALPQECVKRSGLGIDRSEWITLTAIRNPLARHWSEYWYFGASYFMRSFRDACMRAKTPYENCIGMGTITKSNTSCDGKVLKICTHGTDVDEQHFVTSGSGDENVFCHVYLKNSTWYFATTNHNNCSVIPDNVDILLHHNHGENRPMSIYPSVRWQKVGDGVRKQYSKMVITPTIMQSDGNKDFRFNDTLNMDFEAWLDTALNKNREEINWRTEYVPNYAVQMLVGTRCKDRHQYKITSRRDELKDFICTRGGSRSGGCHVEPGVYVTRAELEMAKNVVAAFDFVFVTEDMKSPGVWAAMDRLIKTNSPRQNESQVVANLGNSGLTKPVSMILLNPNLRERFQRENELDIQLYKFVKVTRTKQGLRTNQYNL